MNTDVLLDQFAQLLLTNKDGINIITMILNLLLALAIGLIIATVYKAVHHGVSYSQSYAYSIVLVTVIIALAMIIIGSNITRAFALLGTFSIIRYRTAVKDPKDTAFIFVSLVLGLAAGSSSYSVAILGTIITAFTAIALDKANFGALINLDYILYLTVDAKKTDTHVLETTLKTFFQKITMVNVNFDHESNTIQYTYNVRAIERRDYGKVIQHIKGINGVTSAEILTSQNIIEF
ncbi:DUF4956 domain-containing protein [Candidatus Saccharibacteria bacterium]|nr:DUF4956 domain-containing protein [Candidatus Saccharibacteria bacterium]